MSVSDVPLNFSEILIGKIHRVSDRYMTGSDTADPTPLMWKSFLNLCWRTNFIQMNGSPSMSPGGLTYTSWKPVKREHFSPATFVSAGSDFVFPDLWQQQ